MKIVGILTTGTFHSPWFDYGLASIYNICDTIVVTNCGYDMLNPDKNVWVPVKQSSEVIRQFDIDSKIIELKPTNIDGLKHKMAVLTEKEASDIRASNWFDIRGVALTYAQEKAVDLGADWILKLDSDQVLYKDIKNLRNYLNITRLQGLLFHQTEFAGEISASQNYLSEPEPHTPWNDSVFVYKANDGQFYGGGGAPNLNLVGNDRTPVEFFHCAHLRSCNPIWNSNDDKFQHFFGRMWFRLYTNNYGKFCSQLDQKAKEEALRMLKYENKKPTSIKIPEVCEFVDPYMYISRGY